MKKHRQENYWWLIGYQMGEWTYEGMYWQVDPDGHRYGNNQYEFLKYNSDGICVGSWLADKKSFLEYISGYDLTEVKKVRKQAQ